MALQRMLAAAPLLSAIRARLLHIGKLTVKPVVSAGKAGDVMPLAELPLDTPTALPAGLSHWNNSLAKKSQTVGNRMTACTF